jgi:hypothetical protein
LGDIVNTEVLGQGTFENGNLTELSQMVPWLGDAIRNLSRGKANDYGAFFHEQNHQAPIGTTQAKLRCHILAADGNGHPRVAGLAQKLRNQLLDYAIPRSQVAEAIAEYQRTKSTEALTALEAKARGLFADVTKSGEGGEILLYYLAERVLGFPQVLCKMPLKTNTQQHYHGVDGIHAGVDEKTGRLALYWGESKLYKDVTSGIAECFKSISPFLLEREGAGSASERDFQLLRDNVDFNDSRLEGAFKRFLDPDDALFLKTEFRAICLVGFDYEQYSQIISGAEDAFSAEARSVFDNCATRIESAILANKIDTFVIETFCIPFPCVETFRQAFLNEVGQ